MCTLVSGGKDVCMYDNLHIGILWYRKLYVLICTLVSGGM
jgi:hypothetical protein